MRRLATALLFACIASIATAAPKVAVSYDDYAKVTSIGTEKVDIDGLSSLFDTNGARAWLFGTVSDKGGQSAAIRVAFHASNGWAFFQSAIDSDGKQLPVLSLSQQATGGRDVTEEFLIQLDRDYLAAHVDTGLNVKVYGQGEQMIVKIPADLVRALQGSLTAARELADVRLQSAGTAPVATKVKLGVKYVPVTASVAKAIGQDAPAGVVILEVAPGSVSNAAGLHAGDVVLQLASKPVNASMTGLQELLVGVEPGQEIPAQIWRAGATSTVQLKF